MLLCDVRDRESTKQLLITLMQRAMASSELAGSLADGR
jgi:hypothetical protein